MFEIELGPERDKRHLQIALPTVPKKLGIMVSGGLDSAVMYYLIQKLNIDKWLQKSIHHLSDGEFKKVALCRQLLKNPQMLILDEPTNFLDRENKKDLALLLQEIKNDCVVIVVSHDEHFYNSLETEYILEVRDCKLI